MRLVLTDRDRAVLDLLHAHALVPLEHLAEVLFGVDPFTKKRNKNAVAAAKRRLRTLARAGYVTFRTVHDGVRSRVVIAEGPLRLQGFAVDAAMVDGVRTEALARDPPQNQTQEPLAAKAHAASTGATPAERRGPPRAAPRRRVPAGKLAHHARTLDAVAVVQRMALARGARVVEVRMEGELRRELLRGRMTRRGASYPRVPDAVCTIEVPSAGGLSRRTEVAIEYVTEKYTSKDIVTKAAAFARFSKVLWFADRPATQARVARLTGARCGLLS